MTNTQSAAKSWLVKKERRTYPRAKLRWPVVVKTGKGAVEGVTVNITPNGVFIRCRKPLRLNEVAEITIHIPNSDHSLKATAEVVWSNIYGMDDEITPRGMGFKFLRISGNDRKLIAQASLNHLKSAKVEPKLLDTLNTLIIDLSEDD
jgi:Tfp pilus assembly protein PilZ